MHNDVKPSNILVREQLCRLSAALSDFDAATRAHAPHAARSGASGATTTQLGGGMTPHYAAPEVLLDP